MKNGLLKLVRMAVAPMALVAAMAAFSPVSALAASRGGFSGGHGGFGGGHAYSAPARGGRTFASRSFYGGGRYVGPRYYGGRGFGWGVGVYAPYGYVAPVCNPAGYYDQYGNWVYYPGCAVPYGY